MASSISGTNGYVISIVILSIILLTGIGLTILFYVQYNNITTKESPLCLTAGCKASSQSCGYYPFKFENGSYICKPNLTTDKTPGVTTS